jgi:hypothetical protein
MTIGDGVALLGFCLFALGIMIAFFIAVSKEGNW